MLLARQDLALPCTDTQTSVAVCPRVTFWYLLEVVDLSLGSPGLLPARGKTTRVVNVFITLLFEVGDLLLLLLLLGHSEGLLQGRWRGVVAEVLGLGGGVGRDGARHPQAAHTAPAVVGVRRALPRVGDGGRGGLAVGGRREEGRGEIAHLEGLLQGHLARGLQHYLKQGLQLAVTVSPHMYDLAAPLLHRQRIVLVRAGHLGYLRSTLTPSHTP